ncbi:MAG TPA: DEAD/DEAH box helicase [Gemmataceae bacterium]
MTTALLAEPDTGFRSLQLNDSLLDALRHAKYSTPTPIQAEMIPHALEGRDVIGQAQTGTGKTAAFLLPFLNGWSEDDGSGPQALVMCPTRELAVQVNEEARKLSPSPECRCVPIYGGTRLGGQFVALKKGAHIVVGTPGRVLDHLSRGTLRLDKVRYVVLDEADRMLDIGFRPDIERILRRCPTDRQTMLLSATVPPPVMRLAQRYMKDPVNINLSPEQPTVERIKQSFYTVDEDRKFDLLLRVLVKERPRQCIIFTARKRTADKLYTRLSRKLPGMAEAMHGDLQQSMRERIMADFRTGKVVILVATDVVGRGIDVVGISHIINYDLPDDIENYVHRIGRTGRIGRDGRAISFVTPEQGRLLTDIEIQINKLIDEERMPNFDAYAPRVKAEEEPKPPPKPVFGRRAPKRYSNRL